MKTIFGCGRCGSEFTREDGQAILASCPSRCGYMYLRCARCEAHPRDAVRAHVARKHGVSARDQFQVDTAGRPLP